MQPASELVQAREQARSTRTLYYSTVTLLSRFRGLSTSRTADQGGVVRQQLQRNARHERRETRQRRGNEQHLVGQLGDAVVPFGGDGDHAAVAAANLFESRRPRSRHWPPMAREWRLIAGVGEVPSFFAQSTE